MNNKINELISFILVILLLIIMIIFSFIITYSNKYLNLYSYFIIGIGILCLFNYIFSKILNFNFKSYENIIFIMMIFSILSLPSSINIRASFFGAPLRNEGLFVILSYYLLFLNSLNIKNNKYIKIIIYSILSIGLINVLYGVFQTDLIKTNLNIVNKWYYARGLLGNSMYFGTLMCICTPLTFGNFIKSYAKEKIINFILLLIFLFGSYISGSMSCLVGLIFTSFIALFIYFKNKKIKDILSKNNILFMIISIIIIVLITIFILKYNKNIVTDIKELINEFYNILNGNINDTFGTGRIYIWKNTLIKFKEHPFFGVGIDNFKYAFSPYLIDNISSLIVDKAHNEYLQKLFCEGIFSFITYVSFILIIFFSNIKNINNYKYGLFLSFICYSITIFFSISVIRVAPLYYIIMGLLANDN